MKVETIFPPEDKLRTCEEIAEFYYGSREEWRKIQTQCLNGRFPHFYDGNIICSRKSLIRLWNRLQIARSLQGKRFAPDDIKELLALLDSEI